MNLNSIFILLSDRNTALTYAQNHGLAYTSEGRVHTKPEDEYQNVIYPKKVKKYVKGYISHVSRILVIS